MTCVISHYVRAKALELGVRTLVELGGIRTPPKPGLERE